MELRGALLEVVRGHIGIRGDDPAIVDMILLCAI